MEPFSTNKRDALSWQAFAACRDEDPDLMYPSDGDVYGLQSAKNVCRTCPVRFICEAYAMDTGESWGVWGGLSSEERKDIRRAASRARSRQNRNQKDNER